MGSLEEIFRVQLFSKPQQMQARRMKSEPEENRRLDISSKDRSAQESVISAMPAHRRGLMASLNTASAITAVAGLFLAESFATTSGLGYLIMDAWGMGDVLFMFNAILGMSLLGLVIYGVIGLLERVCCPWLFAGRK